MPVASFILFISVAPPSWIEGKVDEGNDGDEEESDDDDDDDVVF